MKKNLASVIFLFVLFAVCRVATAASPMFWSANGTTLGGTGTWDATTANRFGSSSGGPFTSTWNNANGDTAVLVIPGAGAATTLTVNGVTAGGLIITNSTAAAWAFGTTGTLTLSGSAPTVFLDGQNNSNTTTNSVSMKFIISCAGTFTKTGGGSLNLNQTGSTMGKLVVNGGCMATGNNTAAGEIDAIMGAAPGSLVSDNITLNGGGITFGATASQSNPNKLQGTRGIVLGA
ncbi:MAG: hypothetical protein ACXWC8_10635, partial [Limisphaerales bacterium]